MVAITFLMSSLARLRVSARTVRPAMLAGLGPGPSPRLGRLPSGGLRLGARPGRGSLGPPSPRELAAPSLAARRAARPRPLPAAEPAPARPAPCRPRSAPCRRPEGGWGRCEAGARGGRGCVPSTWAREREGLSLGASSA